MENQLDSAVKTEETTSVTTKDVDEDVVLAEDDGEEVDTMFTDTDLEETDDKGESEAKPKETEEKEGKEKPKQSKEDNKKFAERRREEKAKNEEIELKILKEFVGKNPYTGDPIETLRDVKVYKTMKQIEKDGGDPVQDYHKYAGMEEQKAIDNQKVKKETIKKDVADFKDAFPNVDLNDLGKDKEFVEFANDFVGKVPLKSIYKAYSQIKTNLQTTAEEKAKQDVARKLAKDNTSAGNISSSGDANAPRYTIEQMQRMSTSEISKNWKDVEESYDYWQKHKK